MIKDVKTYLNTVGQRISKAFSVEEFDTESELEFWSLSAEHMSRKEPPTFKSIVEWIDILYKAPVHIVYKKVDEDLILFKRSVNPKNIIKQKKESDEHTELTDVEKKVINDFEQQVQNLQNKKKWYPEFQEHGVSLHSIGSCEHIPIYKKDGEIWGVYIVGPHTKCPEVITPKLSIVGRLLSIWLIRLEQEEDGTKKDYQIKMEEIVSELGSGALNTKAISGLFLRYFLHANKNKTGGVFQSSERGNSLVNTIGLTDEQIAFITETDANILNQAQKNDLLGTFGVYPFEGEESEGFFIMLHSGDEQVSDTDQLAVEIQNLFGKLFDFKNLNTIFSEGLIESYYFMLRAFEMNREKTRFHTPRLMGFVEKFAMVFGLEEGEIDIIMKTAKLHDIGYVGALSVETEQSIGSELNHPLTGYKLIDQLPIHEDIKKGLLTHHEWVNGEGTPFGISGDEIQWTGKIIGIFEFIVDFVETNLNDTSKSDDEWIEQLSKSIIERADKQFDMVIVPTVIQLIQMLGWQNCCKLGADG